jgi:putative ABC transport system permease protein
VGAADISYLSLALCFLLLLIPLGIALFVRVGVVKSLLFAVLRMSVQLALVGIFLRYLFELGNPWANVGWLLVMIVFAALSVIGGSRLSRRRFLLPALASLAVSTSLVLLYFNGLVARIPDILDARYLIAIGGMLLGNALGGNIVGVNDFYQRIERDEKRYLYHLALGSTRREALLPYFRESLSAALRPTIANMATIGLVFLPGMMTGQILGGSSPLVAIKYQLAIMLVILTTIALSVSLTILLTVRASFDLYGVLKKATFRS